MWLSSERDGRCRFVHVHRRVSKTVQLTEGPPVRGARLLGQAAGSERKCSGKVRRRGIRRDVLRQISLADALFSFCIRPIYVSHVLELHPKIPGIVPLQTLVIVRSTMSRADMRYKNQINRPTAIKIGCSLLQCITL